MKALEILQEGLEFMIKAIKVNPNSVKELQSEIDIYNEAIKELEDLKERTLHLESIETDMIMEENKSCYDCKNWSQEFQSIGICDKGIKEEKPFRESMTYHNFYCNKWENKQ